MINNETVKNKGTLLNVYENIYIHCSKAVINKNYLVELSTNSCNGIKGQQFGHRCHCQICNNHRFNGRNVRDVRGWPISFLWPLLLPHTLTLMILLSILLRGCECFHGANLKLSSNIVRTKYGPLRGIIVRSVPLIEAYLGIPYASPPIGSLR